MILITGAAGKTGQAILSALSKAGERTRAFVRRAPEIFLNADEVVTGDLLNRSSVAAALDGVEAVYLICPNVHPNEFEIGLAVISAAKAAGLKRFVYHSVLFPQIEAMPHHWQKMRVEEVLIQSGLDYTVLQPASYMQNLRAYWQEITRAGVYRIPYSVKAEFSPVDLEDVAQVAIRVLLDPGHTAATYALAGPQTLSSNEMASKISEHIGKPVKVEKQAIVDWQGSAKANGFSDYALDALGKMFAYYDQHGFVGNSLVLETLLGRPPTNFAQFLSRLEK